MMNSTHLDLTPVIDSNYTTVLGNKLPFITTLQCLSPALASGTSDGLIRLWDLRTGDVIRQFQGHQSPILDLELNQSGKLCSSDTNGEVRVWDLRSGSTETIWNFDSPVISLGLNNDNVVNIQTSGINLNQEPIKFDFSGEFGEISCAQIMKRKIVMGTTTGSVGVVKGF